MWLCGPRHLPGCGPLFCWGVYVWLSARRPDGCSCLFVCVMCVACTHVCTPCALAGSVCPWSVCVCPCLYTGEDLCFPCHPVALRPSVLAAWGAQSLLAPGPSCRRVSGSSPALPGTGRNRSLQVSELHSRLSCHPWPGWVLPSLLGGNLVNLN